jgi:hypothetical protein
MHQFFWEIYGQFYVTISNSWWERGATKGTISQLDYGAMAINY